MTRSDPHPDHVAMPRTAPAVRAKNGLIAALLAACALGAANADAAMLTPQDLESAEVAAELLSMARESAAASIAGRMPKFAGEFRHAPRDRGGG